MKIFDDAHDDVAYDGRSRRHGKMMGQMSAGMKGVPAHPAAWLACLRVWT